MSHPTLLHSHKETLSTVKTILTNRDYGVEYQPIIDTRDETIVAYEALSRFRYKGLSLSPDAFFGMCHHDLELFAKAESILKSFQFQHRPKGKQLFVNFDPHILHNAQWVHSVFNFFSKQENFVIEVVENSYEAVNTEKLLEIFYQRNYQFAIDDFFKENSMVSVYLLKKCHILKFDRMLINELKITPSFKHVIQGLIQYAHESGKKVIFEGIETQEDFALAKSMNCDYVQGFLFRSQFLKKFHP